jgi:papain like cysteine protease AvrRpt2
LHSIPFLAQPTNTTCWATSTAMVTRTTVPAVIARTPTDLVLAEGSLANFSQSNDPVTGSARFARANFMVVVPPTSWMPIALKSTLARGPLIFDMLWNTQDDVDGAASPGHMIAVVGIRGDTINRARAPLRGYSILGPRTAELGIPSAISSGFKRYRRGPTTP